MNKVAIIGLGNMGYAIAKGMVSSKQFSAKDVLGYDKDEQKKQTAKNDLSINVSDNYSDLKAANAVIIAVKPQNIKETLTELKPFIKTQLIISIAAGVPLKLIREILGDKKIVRCMPNTPALINKGITGVYCSQKVSDNEKKQTESILKAIGEVVFVEKEEMIDMITALSGSGPGYVYYLMEAFEDAGVLIGLSRDASRKLVYQTFLGSAMLAVSSGKSSTELKNMVTSPAGTTITGICELENNRVKGAVQEAVKEAFERSKQLGS